MFLKMIVLLAIVTLLSFCGPASGFALFLPRVSRTHDAVIIDLDSVRQTLFYQDKTFYGPITNPGFIPLNPYSSVGQQDQTPTNGWGYVFEYPSLPDSVKQTPPVCGAGPVITARELTSESISARADAKKGAWPFMIALRKSVDGKIFCSGSLVSDTRILLAAQCFEKMSLYEMSTVTVLVGMYKSDQSDVQMTRRISKVILHGKYNAVTYVNDIALIVLDAPVILSRSVGPVCLPPASADPDQYLERKFTITITISLKWGTKQSRVTVLQQAAVTLMPNSECRVDPNVGKYITDNNLCVTSDNSKDHLICPEDVGGPIVAQPSPGAWTVIGINSYTKDCASNGLKTRVSAYREWIDQYMK